MTLFPRNSLAALTLTSFLAVIHPAAADTWTYNGATASSWNWSTASSWLSGTVPSAAGAEIWITPNINAQRTLSIQGVNRTAGIIHWGDADGDNILRMNGTGGVFTFDNGASDAELNYVAGSSFSNWLAAVPIVMNSSLKMNNATSVVQTLAGGISAGGSGGKSLKFSGGDFTFSGSLADGVGSPASLAVSAGVVSLTNANGNGYSGGTLVSGGRLQIGSNSSAILGTGTLTLTGGAISGNSTNNARTITNAVIFGGNVTLGDSVNVASTGVTFSGQGVLTGNRVLNVASAITYSGAISDGGIGYGFTKDGIGNLILSGSNSYSGSTVINSGTVSANHLDALSASSVTVNAENGLSIVLGTVKLGSLSGTSGFILQRSNGNLGVLSVGYNNTSTVYEGVFTGSRGVLEKVGTGTLTLTGNSSFNSDIAVTDSTRIQNGTLQLGSGGTSGSVTRNVSTGTSTAALAFNRSDAHTFSGTISGSGQVRQVGSGTTSLTAVNTYTGTTSIQAGTLLLSSSSNNIASSAVIALSSGATLDVSDVTSGFILASGQTLAGTGTVDGPLTVGSGAVLAPGNSAGTLTMTSDLTLAAGGEIVMEINGFSPGTFDRILGGSGNQTVFFDPGTLLTIAFLPNFSLHGAAKIFDFENYSGVILSENISFSGLADGFTATFDSETGVIAVVPEPSATGLALLGVGLLIWRMQRRKTSIR